MSSKIKASQLQTVLKKYVGLKESPPNSNNVIFNTRYYKRPVQDGTPPGYKYPWCVVFLWSGFDELGANDLFYGGGKTASCSALMRDAQKRGAWVSDRKALRLGDLAIFDFENDGQLDTNHIGFLVSNDGRYLHTIEGNTSRSGSQSNGGEVLEQLRGYSLCIGGVRPAYQPEEVLITPPPAVLKLGYKGPDVVTLQTRLNKLGFSCGANDGDFGPRTLEAVKAYQAAKGLVVDGVVGKMTWSALMK